MRSPIDSFSVEGLLSPSECAALRDAAAPCLETVTSRGPRHGEARRRHGRARCHSEGYAAQLWGKLSPALRPHLPLAVGLNPELRFYCYSAELGDEFGPHYDQSTSFTTSAGKRMKTLFTVLFYISDEQLRGGETVFYADGDERKEHLRVPPTQGSVLVFPQGTRGRLHASGAVRAGAKWILRSDLAFAVH